MESKITLREEGLTIICLKGSPYEIGFQHGDILRHEIKRIRAHVGHYLSQVKRGPVGWVVYPLLLLLARGYHRFISKEHRNELKGIAHGAGVSYGFILLINVLDDLGISIACSCFSVNGDKTKDGRLVCGRNLDYPLFTDLMPAVSTIFCYQPANGYPFISVAWPGYAGVVTGMNSQKLVLGSLTSYCKEKARRGVPSGLLYRTALQYASSLADLQERILTPRRTISNNLLLASPQKSVVLEISPTRWQSRQQSEDVLTVTNHFQTDSMREQSAALITKPPGSTLPDEFFTEAYSISRNERLQSLCHQGGIGIEEAIEIARAPEVSNTGTVQSLLLIPEALEIWIAKELHTPVSQGDFIKINNLFSRNGFT